jgi:hypothetical protein
MKPNEGSIVESMGLRREPAWSIHHGAAVVFLLAAAVALAGSFLL